MDDEDAKSLVLEHYAKLKQLEVADVAELNHLIDQISTLNFHDIGLEDQIIEEVLLQISHLIVPGNDHILSKFTSLIFCFVYKQKKQLAARCVEQLTGFMISALQSCGEWVLNDVLSALSILFYGNSDKIEKFHEKLLGENGILSNLLASPDLDESIQHNAFLCLLNLLSKSSSENTIKDQFLDICCQKCILLLKSKIKSSISRLLSLKILINSLKCIQLIYAARNIPIKNIGELLGVLKCISFYGLPGPRVTDTVLLPTLSVPDMCYFEESFGESDIGSYPKVRKQKRNRRAKGKRSSQKKEIHDTADDDESDHKNSIPGPSTSDANMSSSPSQKVFCDIKVSSSDSEFSDAESYATKIKSLTASARQNAYQALHAVVKATDKKVMFGYWSSFVPDHPSMSEAPFSQNIFTTILKDPVPQVRFSALVLLSEMLRGSKKFLSHADGRSVQHLSFTSLSSVLTSVINELHRCLLLALLAENSSILITQILKCYAILCENVPYMKLDKDLLMKLVKHIKNFLHHKDTQVQVACLTVFGSIVNTDQIPEEIRDMLLTCDADLPIFTLHHMSLNSEVTLNIPSCELPWIICVCKDNIFNDVPLPIRIESLQLLSSIVVKFFNKIQSSLSILEELIVLCLHESDTSVQLHGAKLLDVFGRCCINFMKYEASDSLESSMKKLWHTVLTDMLIGCLTNDENKTLQSVCCDCLSTVPSDVFEDLPHKQQIVYITILLGLASDSNANVRGAAVRCLGVCSLFPYLSQDLSFLNDVAEVIIKCVSDPNINVRFKASWSLGNLSSAVFSNKSESFINEGMPVQFFYSTGMCCVEFCKDCDRVKANAVRALGNFLYHMPRDFLDIHMIQNFIKDASMALKSALSANVMKVCWNSCYALGNVLKNVNLIQHKIIDLEDILSSLLSTLKSPNFKVRISAVQALTVLTSRELYGNLLPSVWCEFLTAFFSSSDDVNFKEIKHKENLLDQLCYGLCHLAILITIKDLPAISDNTFQASEILLTTMWKFGTRMTTDKAEKVHTAIEHLAFLMNENIDVMNEMHILSILQDILNQAIVAFYGQENKS